MMNLPFFDSERNRHVVAESAQHDHCSQARDELKLVALSEFLKPLMTAVGQRQPWVDDFRDDKIMLSADLYEVIREFARLQAAPSATQP